MSENSTLHIISIINEKFVCLGICYINSFEIIQQTLMKVDACRELKSMRSLTHLEFHKAIDFKQYRFFKNREISAFFARTIVASI